MSEEMEARCRGLLAAFDRKSSVPSEDRQGGPVTPNDPATIAVLATEVLRLAEIVRRLRDALQKAGEDG